VLEAASASSSLWGPQTSAGSAQTLSYMPPSISGLSGLGAATARRRLAARRSPATPGNYFGRADPSGILAGFPTAGPSSIGITLPLASYSRAGGGLPSATGRRLAAMPVMQALNCFLCLSRTFK